jgi:NAD(P)-dependent dehydrogenase (short-subunit alcohol dehydrogenase family)
MKTYEALKSRAEAHPAGNGALRRIAIVTGGHSRVGEAISRRLHAQGWLVLIHAHRGVAQAAHLEIELNGGLIGEPLGVWQADLGDVSASVAGLRAHLDRLEARWAERSAAGHQPQSPQERLSWALVCNASRFDNDDRVTMTEATWRMHHAIHYESPVMLMQALALRDPEAQAVVILDQNVENLHDRFLSYCLSKGAMYAALPRLALALAPFRVNAVAPGPTLPLPGADLLKFEAAAASTPLQGACSPDDVADAVAWLLQARRTTGQTIFVDAGQHLKQWVEPAA